MEQKEGMDGLEKQKWELIDRAKRLDRFIYAKECEMKASEGVLNQTKGTPSAGRLHADIEALEFRIATEAYTRKDETDLLKRVREKKSALAEATHVSRMRGTVRRLVEKIAVLKKEREEVEVKIGTVKAELVKARRAAEHEHFKQKRVERSAEKHQVYIERRKQEIEENEKYMGGVAEGVELGQIAVIRKKQGMEGEGKASE